MIDPEPKGKIAPKITSPNFHVNLSESEKKRKEKEMKEAFQQNQNKNKTGDIKVLTNANTT